MPTLRASSVLLALALVAAPLGGTAVSAAPAAAGSAPASLSAPAVVTPATEVADIGASRTDGGPVLLASREPSGSVGVRWWTPATGLSAPTDLGGQARGGPAIAARTGDRVGVFVRGTDDALWSNVRTGGTWSGWTHLGGVLTARPTVALSRSSGFEVYARGSDGGLWGLTVPAPGGVAPRWQAFGGQLSPGTGPSARESVSAADVMVLGVDGQHWERSGTVGWRPTGVAGHGSPASINAPAGQRDQGTSPLLVTRDADGVPLARDPSGTTSLGGQLVSAPSAAGNSRVDGRVDVFGVGPDGEVYVHSRVDGSWRGWRPIDYAEQQQLEPDDVGAYRPDSGVLRVALSQWGGSVRMHTWDGAGQLSEPTDLGGQVFGGVAVTGLADGSTAVFAWGNDDALWTRTRSAAGSWGPWQSLGGTLAGKPAAVRFGSQLHVFVNGTDGALWHKWSVLGGWSGWEHLGVPDGGPIAEGTGPAAVVWETPQTSGIDVWAFRHDGTPFRRSYAYSGSRGDGWRGWTYAGGTYVSPEKGSLLPDLAAVVGGNPAEFPFSQYDAELLVGVTLDGSPYARSPSGPAQPLGGELVTSPAATGPPTGGNRQDVFGIGTDGRTYAQSRISGTWRGWRPID